MMEVKGALRWKLIMVRRTETAAIKNVEGGKKAFINCARGNITRLN